KNAAGVGVWSEIVTGVTLLNTPVAKATSTTNAITLSWGPIAGAESYEVEVDGVIRPAVTEASFTHSELSAGTSHKYRVRTKTAKNTSDWSTLQTEATLRQTLMLNKIQIPSVTNDTYNNLPPIEEITEWKMGVTEFPSVIEKDTDLHLTDVNGEVFMPVNRKEENISEESVSE
ncbi:hypothetical protein, partial [Paenibacillus sp. NPDC055715]